MTDSDLRGPVVQSQVEHAGFSEGDEQVVRFDQVFDITRLDEEGSPTLNVERAQYALGKTVLVGVTRESPTGERRSQEQFAGRLVAVDAKDGLELELTNGEVWTMPPGMGPWEVAPPGEYRLRSTGEVVTDPDYVCTWVVTERD